MSERAIEVGDAVRVPGNIAGSATAWKVIGLAGVDFLRMSGPGPCRGIVTVERSSVERFYPGELIECAAIEFQGRVWSVPRPGRHHTVIGLIAAEVGAKRSPGLIANQGFTTSRGRFVRRAEAARIAVAAGQIEAPKWGDRLYSEDLW